MPNENDLNNLANTVIDILKCIIKSELEGVFPSLERSKELLCTQAFREKNAAPKVWNCPAYRGKSNEQVVETMEKQDEEEKVIYDVPMYKDLNTNEAVKDVMQYLLEIRKFILKNGVENTDFSDQKPILEEARIAMAGDGSPIITSQNFMRKEEQLKKNHVFIWWLPPHA